MNIDNEVLINAFKEEMIRSNYNSKWWSNHLSEQITNLFGNNLESSVKDAIMSSAKAYIDSGSLATNQFFYTTKELSDKKEIFSLANVNEKKYIYNQINKEDKESIINNNEYLELKDIYDMLTVTEFEYESKKEIANLLDDSKIRALKENYSDLDELLKSWLGERYEQIFGKAETIVEPKPKVEPKVENVVNNTEKKDDIMANYMNATNKVMFFNSIANMQEKQNLFSKLNNKEKGNILNDKNTVFLKSFYNNYQNKEELLGLMNQNTIRTLYGMSGINDKKFISNYLYNREQNEKNSINQNLNNINKETQNITKYNQAIDNSKENISNLKNERRETKLNIKNSKVTIKQLEKRKEKLERKLTNAILNKDSRISFISKKRLERIRSLSNEINLTDNIINNNQEQLRNYQQQLNKVESKIEQEKNSIRDNKESITLASQHIQSYAQQMYNSRVQVRELSSFHKNLVGKKVYNHNRNNIIMTTSKTKTNALANGDHVSAVDKKSVHDDNRDNMTSLNTKQRNNTISSSSDHSTSKQNDKSIVRASQQRTSNVFKNQEQLEREFNGQGITYQPDEYVKSTQNASYLPLEKITSMSYNQAKMMQLYFEAQYAKKMVELAKLQQQTAMGGRSRTLAKAGFSNVIVLLLSLTVLVLLGTLIFLISR